MARLATAGAEAQSILADGLTGGTNSPAIDTTNPHKINGFGGKACFTAAAIQTFLTDTRASAAVSTSYFLRGYHYWTAKPSNRIMLQCFGPGTLGEAWLETDGSVTLRLNNGTALAQSAVLTVAQYYRIDLRVDYPASGASTLTLRINGVVVGSGAGSATLFTRYQLGLSGTGVPGCTWYGDDFALNDSTGASQTSYPEDAVVALMTPVSDNSRTGWTDGAGGTTALWDAVNNVPPAGVGSGSITATSQIKDANNNSTDTYQANIGAYTDATGSGGAGMGSHDVVNAIMATARYGQSSTTALTGAVTAVSNPAGSEATAAGTGTASAAEPTGWHSVFTTTLYALTAAHSVKPVVKVRKGTANAQTEYYDLIGLIVDFTPTPVGVTAGAATTATGSKTASGTTSVTAAATITVTGQKTASSSANVSTRSTVTANGQKVAQHTATVTAAAAVTAIGFRPVQATAALSAAAGVTATGGKLAIGATVSSAGARATAAGFKTAVASQLLGAWLSPNLRLSPNLYLSGVRTGVRLSVGARIVPTIPVRISISTNATITVRTVFYHARPPTSTPDAGVIRKRDGRVAVGHAGRLERQ